MRTPFVAGNWKMHGSRASNAVLLGALARAEAAECRTVVFPPHVYLQQVTEVLQGSSVVATGAQTVSEHDEGAFTGETAAAMLADLGCEYVLVGHSERRSLFGETEAQVGLKAVQCLRHGLKPVICLGESLAQREAGETAAVVERQLAAVLAQIGVVGLAQAVIAYEPVWAIGTGLSASPEQAGQVHAQLRQFVGKKDLKIAENLQIVYGGSVNAGNAAGLFAQADIDGALVGGASLKAEEFMRIRAAACMAT